MAMWTKAERLTSGARDANLPAVDCAIGAGASSPGRRTPKGSAPATGLALVRVDKRSPTARPTSGTRTSATRTSTWCSRKRTLLAPSRWHRHAPLTDATTPKPYVPMAMPTRLTDNNMCKAISAEQNPSDPYCYIDFDTIDDIDHTNVADWLDGLTEPEEGSEFCVDTSNGPPPAAPSSRYARPRTGVS